MPKPEPFPDVKFDVINDTNPGIQLFGRRFFSDQSVMEYLTEFLILIHATKRINDNSFSTPLPEWEIIQNWPSGCTLGYFSEMRLSLKLFSLLGSSRLDTRHSTHIAQYKKILRLLSDKIQTDGSVSKHHILENLENLFLGFQGVGLDRTWCAQAFFPVSKSMLACESNWQQKKANEKDSLQWINAIAFFSAQRMFMARGGELLYLQLCNSFVERKEEFSDFISSFSLNKTEVNPIELHSELMINLNLITNQTPGLLDEIAEWIDKIDGETIEKTNKKRDLIWCAWCPKDTWPESYLFAVELNRICKCAIDPVEKIELLMIGCVLQVLRTLSAQSNRYQNTNTRGNSIKSPLGISWIISPQNSDDQTIKKLSQRNLQACLKHIQQALRDERIAEYAEENPNRSSETLYKEADNKYGHKLFLALGKKLGLIIPQKGPGARFVLTDRIIRYLVLCLIPSGERRTYEQFRADLYRHFGMAIEGPELNHAVLSGSKMKFGSMAGNQRSWLMEMLEASGFLIHLSDACSLVQNPFKSIK